MHSGCYIRSVGIFPGEKTMEIPTTPEVIVSNFYNGLIREAECHRLLDVIKVRGGFENNVYVGFDYHRQIWVRIEQ